MLDNKDYYHGKEFNIHKISHGHTGFTLACAKNKIDIVKVFMEKKYDYNIYEKSADGRDGFYYALKDFNYQVRFFFFLISASQLKTCLYFFSCMIFDERSYY